MEAIQSWVSNHKLATLGKINIKYKFYFNHLYFMNILYIIYYQDQTLNRIKKYLYFLWYGR